MIPIASTLPSNDGYVAAAYIVFFALILIYVTIMAVRLTRVERKLTNLQQARAEERPAAVSAVEEQHAEAGEDEREREAV